MAALLIEAGVGAILDYAAEKDIEDEDTATRRCAVCRIVGCGRAEPHLLAARRMGPRFQVGRRGGYRGDPELRGGGGLRRQHGPRAQLHPDGFPVCCVLPTSPPPPPPSHNPQPRPSRQPPSHTPSRAGPAPTASPPSS